MAYEKTMSPERKLSALVDKLEKEVASLKFENKQLRLALKDFREINFELHNEIKKLKEKMK